MKVSVLIPAYNEGDYIYQTVQALVSLPQVDEVVVVDDASRDDTALLAQQAGARVISLAANLGKGGALNRGLGEVDGDIVVLLDGDLGYSAGEAGKLIDPVLKGEADMTIARFPRARKKGGFGLVKGLARWGIKFFTGLEMFSPLSGQRVMTRPVIESIGTFASGYGVEVGLTIDVARRGFRVREVEVQMTHAETGRDISGFKHRGKQFIHVARVLAWKLVTR
ncbi:MAG: glycosyltransferase family 2 protein [Clostridia bacterium]|nr:glycosyltransferase family 2 protein [Clostridia bacterium]